MVDPERLKKRLMFAYRDARKVPMSPEVREEVLRERRIYNKVKLRPNGFRMGRPPAGVHEIKLGWEGVVRLMTFFNNDRKLAARVLDISLTTVGGMVRKGYVPVYIAVIAAWRCDTMQWNAWDLVKYIPYDENQELWDWWVAQYPEIRREIDVCKKAAYARCCRREAKKKAGQ